jgi:hypothetical protein
MREHVFSLMDQRILHLHVFGNTGEIQLNCALLRGDPKLSIA